MLSTLLNPRTYTRCSGSAGREYREFRDKFKLDASTSTLSFSFSLSLSLAFSLCVSLDEGTMLRFQFDQFCRPFQRSGNRYCRKTRSIDSFPNDSFTIVMRSEDPARDFRELIDISRGLLVIALVYMSDSTFYSNPKRSQDQTKGPSYDNHRRLSVSTRTRIAPGLCSPQS